MFEISGSGLATRGTCERRRHGPFAWYAAGMLAVAGMPSLAVGQAAETAEPGAQPLEEVVVTGTKIRSSAPVGSPVVQFDEEDIERSGYTLSSDLLRAMPNLANLGADESRIGTGHVQNAGANVTAATGINLRGLGTEATLVLVNGRRLPPGGQGGNLIDPNVIPMLALDRMEVVADGASAIYGSDAVGGVVNLLLRDTFDGVKLSTRYGTGDDVSEQQHVALLGTTWEGGGVYLALEKNKRDDLSTDDRLSLYSEDFRDRGGPDSRTTFGNPGTLVVGGTSYAIPSGQDGRSLTPGDLVPGTTNLHRSSLHASILPDQDRETALAVAEHQLNERVLLGVEFIVSERQFWRATGQGSQTLTVPDSNAFFVSPDPSATSVQVQYSFVDDFGPSYQFGFEDVWQGALTAEVGLWSDWMLSTHVSHGRTATERESGPQIQTGALNAALADPDPATAFNPFGDGRHTNPDTLASILGAESLNHVTHTMTNYTAVADGSLFELPGGTVRAAVGYEFFLDEIEVYNLRGGPVPRVESIRFDNDRRRNAFFGEFVVPLVGPANAVPGIASLDLNLALRHEEASDFGGTTNPKLGVSWDINNEVSIRGSWGESYRAPTLTEVSPFAIAAGFPRPFPDPQSPTGVTRGVMLFGGSPGLEPETATTWSLGMDWRPEAVPGLMASLTYFDIEYEDRIDRPGQEANVLFREDELAPIGVVIRNPSQEFLDGIFALPVYLGPPEPAENFGVFVDARLFNVGTVRTSGLDANLDYTWHAADSEWRVGLLAAYVDEYAIAATPGAETVNYVDRVNYPPELRARLSGGWQRGPWRVSSFVNWTNEYTNGLVSEPASVDAYTTVDLQVSYLVDGGWLDGFQVLANARNLFDEDPPFARVGTVAYDGQSASPLGRMLSLQLMKEW